MIDEGAFALGARIESAFVESGDTFLADVAAGEPDAIERLRDHVDTAADTLADDPRVSDWIRPQLRRDLAKITRGIVAAAITALHGSRSEYQRHLFRAVLDAPQPASMHA